ncbi:MAG: endonuclease [Balneolaceae bacterium]
MMPLLHPAAKRTLALVFFSISAIFSTNLFAQSCPAQGTQIFPNLSGQELIDALVQEYKTTSVLSYNAAREQMYGDIDNVDGFVEGIYTGYKGAIDPDGENPRTQANAVNINAEHTWPQSKGATRGTLAHSDMHHLHPTYGPANSSRNNHPFYEIPDDETSGWWRYRQSNSSPVADSIDEYSEFRSFHPNNAYSASWEPRESMEGDIARGMIYFYTMYKNQADDSDPIFFEVQKEFFRYWNSIDSVSQREYDRTCAIAPYQDDKVNPFVIDPTLVERAYFEGAISQTNVFFSGTVFSISEGQTTFDIQVSISNPNADTATTVDVIYAGGSATAGEDFQNYTSQTITFPAGSLDRQNITLTIIDDDLVEQDETILLALEDISGPQNSVMGQADTTEITIRDNDGDIPSSAWINEFHYDNDGTDEGEFIEIAVNAEFAYLTDVTITLYNGSNGSAYGTYSGNDFIAGDVENGISFFYLDFPSNGVQNGGPDGISLDIDGELIQFLSYEGVFTAVDGPAKDVESTDVGVEQTNESPIGSSLSLTGSGDAYQDFTWIYTDNATAGNLNEDQEITEPTSREEQPEIADRIQLHQNYPNPFNPTTTISYELKSAGSVSLTIYNVIGRKVASLVEGHKPAGYHAVVFDASNLSSGVYFYQLSAGEITFTQKMLLSK